MQDDYDTALRMQKMKEFYDGPIGNSKKRNGPLPDI